jgi:AAA domain
VPSKHDPVASLADILENTKRHHSVQRGDALRTLERSGFIAQATLTKLHRQRIPEQRAAIEDLSNGQAARASASWTGLEPFKK